MTVVPIRSRGIWIASIFRAKNASQPASRSHHLEDRAIQKRQRFSAIRRSPAPGALHSRSLDKIPCGKRDFARVPPTFRASNAGCADLCPRDGPRLAARIRKRHDTSVRATAENQGCANMQAAGWFGELDLTCGQSGSRSPSTWASTTALDLDSLGNDSSWARNWFNPLMRPSSSHQPGDSSSGCAVRKMA